MDTEEDHHLQEARRKGHPETDEGPYYHVAWWEAYKGNVKGVLGGSLIGAGMGGLVGAVAGLTILPALGLFGGTALLTCIGGFAAAGVAFGVKEFGDVGTTVGSGAATAEILERRTLAGVRRELAKAEDRIARRILRTLTGKDPGPSPVAVEAAREESKPNYRTQHCDDHHCPPEGRKIVFWKVAGIGLAVGMLAGTVLAWGGGADIITKLLAKGVTLSSGAATAAVVGACGLIGASFGINRDIFRKVFDFTDRLFKGILPGEGKQAEPEKAMMQSKAHAAQPSLKLEDAVQEKPSTCHRDRLTASAARRTLLGLDHTNSVRH